ncbi:MAG: hypothetical protein AAGA61_09560 [Pseudomonadota bacterium]
MPKLSQWTRMFSPGKETVSVQVGDAVAEMTKTQRYRFDQLSRTWSAEEEDENPFEKSRYTLAEAALSLLQTEAEILSAAAAGQRHVYVNGEGLTGRWRRSAANGSAVHSQPMQLVSGYLALPPLACAPLADGQRSVVSVLECRLPADPSFAEFDASQLANLRAWGAGQKFFCLTEPLSIRTEAIVLLAPLSAAS